MPQRLIAITGVTRGLGRALVDRFVEAGHRVLGCARSEDAIIEMHISLPGRSAFSVVDVSVWSQVQAWAQSVLEQHGTPDLVINNAALMNAPAPLWQVGAEEFERLLRVNLAGPANVVRALAPAMIEARRGVFVNLSSGWGSSTAPGVGPYCSTKWGIEGFSRALADDLPAGLASVAWSPGVIDTEMLRACFGAGAAEHWGPEAWSGQAAEALLALSAADNGRSLRFE